MMNKKWLPHILAAVSLAVFVVLGLASGASTPSSYSSSSYSDSSGASSSSSQSRYLVTIYYSRKDDGYKGKWAYNIEASSEQGAKDEAVYRFIKEFPELSITDYFAVKLY